MLVSKKNDFSEKKFEMEFLFKNLVNEWMTEDVKAEASGDS